MKFFIDYENVHAQGFRGVEYLEPADEVVLFYSNCCRSLEKGILDKLFNSGCGFELIKLKNAGHNALDFYITSHIGETLGRGYEGSIGIVSHDKGFKAIRDYWQVRNPKMKIICKPDLAHCILGANDILEIRWKKVYLEYTPLYLEKQYELFEKRKKLQTLLESILENTDREWSLEELAKDLVHRQAGRETYLSLMRLYGVVDGLAFYQALKKIV